MNRTRNLEIAVTDGARNDILGPNALTAAGVLFAGSTCVASTMLLATAMPVQVLGSATIAGGLYTAGKLQEAGKLPNPFDGKKEDKSSSTVKSDAKSDDAPAAAAA